MQCSVRFKLLSTSIIIVLFFSICTLVFAQEFPYRKKYPAVNTISTEELYKKSNEGNIIIVDVRSDIEFAVIHPIGSKHIPIGRRDFSDKVGELIGENLDKGIAFYCNGITCLKSYEAAKRAQDAGCKNCSAYDAGIPAWADTYPDNTLLLGEKIIKPEEQIIPKSEFKNKCLSFDDFKQKAKDSDAIVIDVRDNIQINANLPEIEVALSIPLDKFIPNFIERRINQNKTLLIFDQVGKQVRWLMYYLVKQGYKDYYFLNKGATGILKSQEYKK